jgi:CBS domain-containing protein
MVKVKDIMRGQVITVDSDINISDVAKIMTNNRIGSVIVMKKLEAVGIITDDDIVGVVARGGDPKKIKVKDIKKGKNSFVTALPNEDILKITKRMIKSGVKRIPVMHGGKLVGIVSDKEILLTAPELISVISEKLKMRVGMVSKHDQTISGICELCESYSDELKSVAGKWVCEDCRD